MWQNFARYFEKRNSAKFYFAQTFLSDSSFGDLSGNGNGGKLKNTKLQKQGDKSPGGQVSFRNFSVPDVIVPKSKAVHIIIEGERIKQRKLTVTEEEEKGVRTWIPPIPQIAIVYAPKKAKKTVTRDSFQILFN
jgi:hypothetical protein